MSAEREDGPRIVSDAQARRGSLCVRGLSKLHCKFVEEFFLAVCGLKLTAKKADLVARAFGAYELNVPKTFSHQEIYSILRLEYNSRLSNSLSAEAWQASIHEWPEVDEGKLFSYISQVKSVDVDYIGIYKGPGGVLLLDEWLC